jgi:hypothetical protein
MVVLLALVTASAEASDAAAVTTSPGNGITVSSTDGRVKVTVRERMVVRALGLAEAPGNAFPSGTATYRHLAGDAVFKWRGVSLLAEGLLRDATEDVVRAEDGTSTPTRSGWGWVAQGGVMTGPRLEVAARVADLVPRDGTDPMFVRAHELGAGGSLYLDGHRLKVQAGWTAVYAATFQDAQHSAIAQLDATF